ncbi:hypothetical protein ABK040_007661 [Willaertia magna]
MSTSIPLHFGHTLTILNEGNGNIDSKNYKLFLFGGNFFKDNLLTISNNLFEINLVPNNNNKIEEEYWNEIKVQNYSTIKERVYHSAIIYENELIIFGGMSNNECFNDMYLLDLNEKDEWKRMVYQNNELTSVNYIPSPRYGHTMCIYKDKLYLFGGFTNNESQISNELFQFNLKEHEWKLIKLDKKIKGRYHHTMNIIDDNIFIFGGLGESNDSNETSILDDLIIIDLSFIENNLQNKAKVTTIGKLNRLNKKIARYGHCSCQFKNKLLFIGGCNKENDFFFNHFEFDLDTKQFNERNYLQLFSNNLSTNNQINCDKSLPIFSTVILLNEDNFYCYGGKINKFNRTLFYLPNFEEKLNNDEKKAILSFLDISSICNVNCVSKSFSLSQLSNDDLFWKESYKRIIAEYFNPIEINYIHDNYRNDYLQKQQNMSKETEEKINTSLQLITKDYKNEIIKFVNQMFKKAETIQKERLSKMEFNKDIYLWNKDSLLKEKDKIMKGYKQNSYSDCKLVVVGDNNVGKTSLVMVLGGSILNIINTEYFPTVYDYFNIFVPLNSNKENFVITLWDTSGADDYDRIRPLILKASHGNGLVKYNTLV